MNWNMSAQYNQLTPITPSAVKAELLRLAEQGNKPFTQSLNPGVPNVLGIRIPHLRELAKKIAKDDWQAYLATADTYYMEERMLQGMVLGCIRPDEDVEVYLERVTRFVRLINSWSVCDTFKFGGGKRFIEANKGGGKRFIEANKDRLWEYLKGWMQAGGEYEIRFGVVMTMQLFIDEAHIHELLRLYDGIRHEGYYVRMGVAWALSVCFVRFPDLTMRYLREGNTLDDFTYNKTLQKITESYRVDGDTKQVIKGMRRK